MNTKKFIIITFAIVLVCLCYYFRLFFFPLQILSIREIEQNQQGICLAENRKLSENELLNRGMKNYFSLLKQSQIPVDESMDKFMPECVDNYCKVTQLYPYSIVDYIKFHEKNPEIKRITPQGIKIRTFEPTEVSQYAVFDHQKDNSFSLYITKLLRDNFYPTDCCRVNNLDYFVNNGFSLDNMPKNWRSIGKGNYYLILKYLSISNHYGGDETFLEYETLPLGNCGEVYLEGFSEKRDFKNPDITMDKSFMVMRSNVKEQDYINTKCNVLKNIENRYQFFYDYSVRRHNNQIYLCEGLF